MTQTSNRLFDEFAKLMTDAAGVAQGVRREVDTIVRAQAERFLADMDLVRREDFEVVREMVVRAREENERLAERVARLEAALAGRPAEPAAPAEVQVAASSAPASPAPASPLGEGQDPAI